MFRVDFLQRNCTMQRMLKWLLIGIGDIARRRVIPALLAEPRSRLVGFVTHDPCKAEPWGLPSWPTLDEALSSERFDAVYVGTPPALHCPQTLTALRAGCHVLCEKPFGLNYQEARRMVDEAGRLERTLGVAYYRRFYPKLLKAKELIAAGVIGRPLLAELVHHVWLTPDDASVLAWLFDPSVAGGGPLYDVGSHRIDVLNFLFGKPMKVNALLSRERELPAVEDAAAVLIEYERGVRGVVDVSWRSHEQRDECRILGSGGEIRLSPLNGPRIEWPGGEEDLPIHANPHLPCIENFVSAVQLGEQPASSGETASWTDWVTEQAVLSSGG
jgi:1,5-anhydro-D-fructose reductase (1,5-anhydro-D-mannitol-forming)